MDLAAEELFASPLFLVGLAFGLVGLLQMAAGFVVLFQRQPAGFAIRLVIGIAVAAIGLSTALIGLGMQGYQALTREEVAATISVRPSAPQRFDAQVRFADGRTAGYVLAGDELYVDAHILKWKPVANLFGLHTAYELDRISGRYRSVEQERNALRTVYPLREGRAVELFDLRNRYGWLAPLYDAEYGSGTFVPVNRPMELEVRVSTTGLLVREAKKE